MNSQQLISDIRNYCMKNANEANFIKYSRYFKDGNYSAYGLSTLQMESKVKELLKMPGLSLSVILEAAPAMIQNGKHEEAGIAILLVRGLHRQYTRETYNQIEAWYSYGINNWAQADALATQILPRFISKSIIQIADLANWLTAKNKFQRRCVPVTLIKLLKTHENYSVIFAFIECLMTDPEREVHQGTGWFLREAWKRKPEETETFMLKWKNISPRLIFQYATEKMTAEGKMRFRRDRI